MAEYRNHEGYPDPTAWAALKHIEEEERQAARLRAKDFLASAARLDGRIQSRIEQLGVLRSLAEKVTGSLQRSPNAPAAGRGRTEEIILELARQEQELQADIDALLRRRREIRELIARVPREELQSLLELRYLACLHWEEIALRLSYSLHYLYRLHNRALDAVDALLQEDTSGQ